MEDQKMRVPVLVCTLSVDHKEDMGYDEMDSKVVDLTLLSTRKWLTSHMLWAVNNGKFVTVSFLGSMVKH